MERNMCNMWRNKNGWVETHKRGVGGLNKVLKREATPRSPNPYPCYILVWTIKVPLSYTDLNDKFLYTEIYLNSEKGTPFRAEPPRIGHVSEPPLPCLGRRLLCYRIRMILRSTLNNILTRRVFPLMAKTGRPPWKGYLFQASGIWKCRDLTSRTCKG